MSATRAHTLDEIRGVLAIEREYLEQIGFRGGVVPVEEITARAGFFATAAERSRVEVADFLAEPPDRYFAYHTGEEGFANPGGVRDTITTWVGDELAVVIDRRPRFTSRLGDRRQHFRAVAINGRVYSATAYLSAGSYVRMRQVKPRNSTEAARASRYAHSHTAHETRRTACT